MYLPDELKQQLLSATTRREALELIMDNCFREEQQDEALDFVESNTTLFN
jgi:hypothetical protein